MASLYEIDGRVWDVIQRGYSLDEETGEFWDDAAFSALDMERNAKLEGCALYIKNMEADVEAMRAEEKKLAERRRVLENRAERMRAYVANSMLTFGDAKIETARVSLSFRKSDALVIADGAEIPEAYVVTKTTTAPDKAALKKALKAGTVIPGVTIEQRQNLQLK